VTCNSGALPLSPGGTTGRYIQVCERGFPTANKTLVLLTFQGYVKKDKCK